MYLANVTMSPRPVLSRVTRPSGVVSFMDLLAIGTIPKMASRGVAPIATAGGTALTVRSRSAGVGSSLARMRKYCPRMTAWDSATGNAVRNVIGPA